MGRMSNLNPYAPPQTDALGSVSLKDAKARRTNLINRRTVALLVDGFPYALLVGVPFSVFLRVSHGGFPGAGWLAQAPLYLFRDAFGSAGVGKRLVRLGIADAASGGTATRRARIVRGLPLIFPAVPLIEYFVAYYGNATMQRTGDMLARTRVVDLAPERFGKSSWTWQLLAALAVAGSLYVFESATLLTLFET